MSTHNPRPASSSYSTLEDDSAPRLAAMPTAIEGWTDLPAWRRRDLRSTVNATIRICATPDDREPSNAAPPELATMSCAYLNTKLFRRAPALYGIRTPEHFANILSRLRFILRRIGGHDERWAGVQTLTPGWRALYDALPTVHRQVAMASFMRFCAEREVAPEAVTSAVLASFEAWLLRRTLCRDAPVRARTVSSNWSWARVNVAVWPDLPLTRPRTRAQYVLPLSAFPPELQADVERFLGRLACSDPGDIFADDAPTDQSQFRRRRALKPRTIEGRRFQLRQCLSAMVIEGRDAATITSLRQLVDPPEQANSIMRFFMARSGNKQTSQTGAIGEVLRQLARFHCRLDAATVATITRWSKNVAPEIVFAISEKNMQRLQRLMEPHTRFTLLNLPITLLKEAANPDLRPHAAGLLAMNAIALDVLFAFPVRRSNLAGLRLDQHLQRSHPKSRLVDFISIPAEETKTGRPLMWPLAAEVAERIERYVKRHRPHMTLPGNPFLFPQATSVRGRSPHDLAVGLTELVEARLGCRFNLQLVRHLIVAIYLERHPGQYDMARHLLGHAKASYTTSVYDGMGAASAARQLDSTLTHARSGTPSPTLPTAPGSGKPRRGRKGR